MTEPAFPRQLRVEPWVDPTVEADGFPAGSAYVEALWLGVIGPTAAWTLRRLACLVAARPAGATVDLAELGVSLGVGSSLARNSTMSRTIDRLVSFRLASWDGEVLRVRRVVPPLSRRQVSRLPASLVAVHDRMLTAGRGRDGLGV